MTKIKLILTIIIISLIINLWFLFLIYFYTNFLNFDKNHIDLASNVSLEWWYSIMDIENMNDLQKTVINTIKEAWKWVVSIVITRDLQVYYQDPFNFFGWYAQQERRQVWWWSWIIVSKDWYIITNKHVVNEATSSNTSYTVVTRDWFSYSVDRIWLDPILDIAVLKIVDDDWNVPSNLDTVNLIWLEQEVLIWQFVIAIWNALSQFQDSATFWIISWKWRQLDNVPQDSLYVWLYQTDTAINPWNSWWPLMDIWWNVLWINTAISAVWQWIGFSIPINKKFVDSTIHMIRNDHSISRPFLWIQHIDINPWIFVSQNLPVDRWVLIQNVIEWSSAYEAWLKPWDIILSVDWNPVWAWNTFLYNLFAYKPWDEIILTIYSPDWNENVPVILWNRN